LALGFVRCARLAYGTTIKLSRALEYVVIPMEDGEFANFSKFFLRVKGADFEKYKRITSKIKRA